MAWHAIGRGIGRASHLGVKVARAAVIFSSCDSATESGRTNPTPRLRVGLQSTLGLSPDSSVAIDCQNVSPEPGAFDDTAGPARRVCARPFCERCPTSDRLWPNVRETITKPGFRSVTFGLFFIWRNRGSNDSPPASFVAVKGRDCAEGASKSSVRIARMPITTTFHDFVASKIQAAWRRALDRRAFLERRRAVVVIQSRFRRNARREKVRVSVRAFSSGEATTRPKTEASLEPSPTRARASPRLRSRERTTPRRDTARGGVCRRLQNLSRPNADSTTGSVRRTRSAP